MSENGNATNVVPADGPAAPPRSNGELVFEEPWQSRIFGVTMALHQAGRFDWSEFQARLIDAIDVHERVLGLHERADAEAIAAERSAAYDYYGCWLEAFRSLATEKGWLDAEALGRLERELRARPAGHDHRH